MLCWLISWIKSDEIVDAMELQLLSAKPSLALENYLYREIPKAYNIRRVVAKILRRGYCIDEIKLKFVQTGYSETKLWGELHMVTPHWDAPIRSSVLCYATTTIYRITPSIK